MFLKTPATSILKATSATIKSCRAGLLQSFLAMLMIKLWLQVRSNETVLHGSSHPGFKAPLARQSTVPLILQFC
ncbi:hypothetical protein J6590_093754 [Homalodisca vitripennis]|nr:hypothetical protein J6590_093754 [Homalodisca vitripennis]